MKAYPRTLQMLDEAYIEDRFTVASGVFSFRCMIIKFLGARDFEFELKALDQELREIASEEGYSWDAFLKLHPLALAAILGISQSHFHEINAKINGIK